MNVLLVKNVFNKLIPGYIRINGQKLISGKVVNVPATKNSLVATFLFSFLVNFKKIRLDLNGHNNTGESFEVINLIETINMTKFIVSSVVSLSTISILTLILYKYSQSLIPIYSGIILFIISFYTNFINNITLHIDEN